MTLFQISYYSLKQVTQHQPTKNIIPFVSLASVRVRMAAYKSLRYFGVICVVD